MPRLMAFDNVTLDGRFAGPNGDLGWAHKDDPEWRAFIDSNASGNGRLVFGRVTYQMMASYWPTPLAHQTSRTRWDKGLLAEGLALLERSASGTELTSYHIESAIAAEHARAASLEETNWDVIVSLYDRLTRVAPSPVVALNRAIAIAERDGAERGLAELRAIEDRERLAKYPFYAAAVGELELRLGNREAARESFEAALALARNAAERHFLEQRLSACGSAAGGDHRLRG